MLKMNAKKKKKKKMLLMVKKKKVLADSFVEEDRCVAVW